MNTYYSQTVTSKCESIECLIVTTSYHLCIYSFGKYYPYSICGGGISGKKFANRWKLVKAECLLPRWFFKVLLLIDYNKSYRVFWWTGKSICAILWSNRYEIIKNLNLDNLNYVSSTYLVFHSSNYIFKKRLQNTEFEN